MPDASPMVADRDAYIAVVAQRGVADSLRVYVPDTPLLLLKHVVDAIESWGEQALVDRAKISRNGRVDSVSKLVPRPQDCDACWKKLPFVPTDLVWVRTKWSGSWFGDWQLSCAIGLFVPAEFYVCVV